MSFGINPGIPGARDTELATEAKQDEIIAAIDNISIPTSTTYITILRAKASDPDITYIGKAVPGTATSDAAWQIASLDENTNVDLLYADGGAFTQVYDDRESLGYA